MNDLFKPAFITIALAISTSYIYAETAEEKENVIWTFIKSIFTTSEAERSSTPLSESTASPLYGTRHVGVTYRYDDNPDKASVLLSSCETVQFPFTYLPMQGETPRAFLLLGENQYGGILGAYYFQAVHSSSYPPNLWECECAESCQLQANATYNNINNVRSSLMYRQTKFSQQLVATEKLANEVNAWNLIYTKLSDLCEVFLDFEKPMELSFLVAKPSFRTNLQEPKAAYCDDPPHNDRGNCPGTGQQGDVGNFPPDPDVELIKLPIPPKKKKEQSYQNYGQELDAWTKAQIDFPKVQFVKIPMQPFCDQELYEIENCADSYLYTTKEGLQSLIAETIKNDLVPSGVPDLKSLGAVIYKDTCALGKVIAYCRDLADDMLLKTLSLAGLERAVCN